MYALFWSHPYLGDGSAELIDLTNVFQEIGVACRLCVALPIER